MDPLTQINTRRTPQSEPADPRQAKNAAGGYIFQLTPLQRLRRFLILGVDAGTYYVDARTLTRDNATVIIELARTDPQALVDELVQVSTEGRAPRQNPTLFALAIAASIPERAEDRQYALGQLKTVARTTTHLFTFVNYVKQFRGFGRALTTALASWYLDQPLDRVAYQVVKYRQREGWTHRDLLRVAHPLAGEVDAGRRALFDWVTHPDVEDLGRDAILAEHAPVVDGYRCAQLAPIKDVPDLVRRYGLTWEMLTDESLTQADTWRALLDADLPITALIRQLPRLTNLGLLDPLKTGNRLSQVVERLTDHKRLRNGRVHPLRLLLAHRTYASGHGVDGKSTWRPVGQVVDALDRAFTLAFGAVEPTGKRLMLALDVSGSMGMAKIARTNITAREASAALALVTAATETNYGIYGFTSNNVHRGYSRDAALAPLHITPHQRLDDSIRAVSNLSFGATDCALPMRYALQHGLDVDTFVIYTDNETWAGSVHPHQALREYREKRNPQARLAVVGMTSTGFSVADPSDPGQLDVVGFDAGTPQLISDFARGVL